MQEKKVVTFFYGSLERSLGPAIHFAELWNNFTKMVSDEVIVKGYVAYEKSSSVFTALNFQVEKVRLFNVKKVRLVILDVILSYYLIRNRKNIVYVRLTVFNLFTAIAIKLFHIRPIVELNGIVDNDLSTMGFPAFFNKISKWQSNKIIESSAGCIAVSDAIARDARSKGAKNVVTIKNGVSETFFSMKQKPTSVKIKAIYVGTFTPWDGAADILALAKHYPEVEFNLYGVGDETLRKQLLAQKSDNVNFWGYVSYADLPYVYAKHDLGIVLYSLKRNNQVELSSLKTLEYVASGLPVFTTNVNGQEFISQNKLGVNIQIEHMVSEFREFIFKLDQYKVQVDLFRKENQNKISWHGVASKTYQFLREIKLL